MQATRQASPEVQMTAEKYVGTGYQRLLTFEVPGGGFSLFGFSLYLSRGTSTVPTAIPSSTRDCTALSKLR